MRRNIVLGGADRDRVAVGDVVQLDGDAWGDRDHTAVVSRTVPGGPEGRIIEVAEHSPAGPHDSVDALIAAHGGHGVVHYWHLIR